MYIGVDWQSDASCCALCNGGSWTFWFFPGGPLTKCVSGTTPQLLCSSEQEGEATMLRHGEAADE
eukprot:8227633-Ditylum_brightwellii.AAC.1